MKFLLWILISYGITTIIVYGSIFEGLRNWLEKRIPILGIMINCVLCTSTWVGFFLSFIFNGITNEYFETGIFTFFFDGMFTAGSVWALNSFIEFFEESRINLK